MHYEDNSRKQLVIHYTMKFDKQVDDFIANVQMLAEKHGYVLENNINLAQDPIDAKVAGRLQLFEDMEIDSNMYAVLAGDTFLIRKEVRGIARGAASAEQNTLPLPPPPLALS